MDLNDITIYEIFALAITLTFFYFLYSLWQKRKRTNNLQKRAPLMGLSYSPEGRIALAEQFQVSHRTSALRRGVNNFMEGNIGSIADFAIFDYTWIHDTGGRNSREYSETAILFQSDQLNLLSFELCPTGYVTLFSFKLYPKMFDPADYYNGFHFDAFPTFSKWYRFSITPPKAKKEGASKQCPACGNWDVYGPATIESGSQGDWCPHCKKSLYRLKIEESFNVSILSYFDNHPDWYVAGSGTQLLLSRKEVPLKKIQWLKEEVLVILGLFQ